MKRILLIIFILSGLGTAYSQNKFLFSADPDTIVFINFNESDLGIQKKTRLLEARQQNRISDAWDLKQFYVIDARWFKRYTDKLVKELKKGKITPKFVSVPGNSSTTNSKTDNWSMTTDFKVEESTSGNNLIIYMMSTLLGKDGKLIMEGDATGIIRELRERK